MIGFLFSLVFSVQAKYSSEIKFIPCNELTIELKACENRKFSNSELLRSSSTLVRRREIHRVHGALVFAKISNAKPGKCHKDQKIDLKNYRRFAAKEANLYILNKKCEDLPKKDYIVSLTNLFCDTPGAYEIESCFFSFLEGKHKMRIAQFGTLSLRED